MFPSNHSVPSAFHFDIVYTKKFEWQIYDFSIACVQLNLRMAQGTQCLHAVRNYMKKVKSIYQHVMSIITHYHSNLKSHMTTNK